MAKETKPAVTQSGTGRQDFHTGAKEDVDRKKAEEKAAGVERQDTQAPKSAPDEVPDKAKSKDAPSEEEGSAHGEPESPPSGSRTITLDGTGSLAVMVAGKPKTIERGKSFKADAETYEAVRAMGESIKESGKGKKEEDDEE